MGNKEEETTPLNTMTIILNFSFNSEAHVLSLHAKKNLIGHSYEGKIDYVYTPLAASYYVSLARKPKYVFQKKGPTSATGSKNNLILWRKLDEN